MDSTALLNRAAANTANTASTGILNPHIKLLLPNTNTPATSHIEPASSHARLANKTHENIVPLASSHRHIHTRLSLHISAHLQDRHTSGNRLSSYLPYIHVLSYRRHIISYHSTYTPSSYFLCLFCGSSASGAAESNLFTMECSVACGVLSTLFAGKGANRPGVAGCQIGESKWNRTVC
jgi:hypothetical protein